MLSPEELHEHRNRYAEHRARSTSAHMTRYLNRMINMIDNNPFAYSELHFRSLEIEHESYMKLRDEYFKNHPDETPDDIF